MIVFYRMRTESPNMRKVSLMLHECDLAHEVHYVEKDETGKLGGDFLAVSPNATAPAIVDKETGATVFETAAVIHYLAEKTGKLLPAAPAERADVMKWLFFESANVGPAMREVYYGLYNDVDDHDLQRHKDALARHTALLDRQLAGRDYVAGELSIADLALYPWIEIVEDMADLSLDDYPNVQGWVTSLSERYAAL